MIAKEFQPNIGQNRKTSKKNGKKLGQNLLQAFYFSQE